MDKSRLKSIIKQSAKSAVGPDNCPDDYTLASYIDGGLSEPDHERFELHLADCAYCLQRISLLGLARETEIGTPVPDLLLARAGKLPNDSPSTEKPIRRGLWHAAPRWAVAAVVVLAMGAVLQMYPGGASRSGAVTSTGSPEHTNGIPETRNINPNALTPQLQVPHEGMTVTPSSGAFRWTPVTDSLYYSLRIVSDEGDLVWLERVDDPQWVLPVELKLNYGAEYFVRIDAYLAESKSISSDYVLFRAGRFP